MEFTVLQEMSLQGYFICAVLFLNTIIVARIAYNTSKTLEETRWISRESKQREHAERQQQEREQAEARDTARMRRTGGVANRDPVGEFISRGTDSEPERPAQYGTNRTAELMREAARERRGD